MITQHWKQKDVKTLNPYGYTGREIEQRDLYYYRARYYDPTTQRFLSLDPIGFLAGDFNFYRYVRNSPVGFRDPLGLESMIYLSLDVEKKDFRKATKHIKKQHKGAYFIYAHGNDDSTLVLATDKKGKVTEKLSPKDLLKKIKNNGYKEGQTIVMFSCNSGKDSKTMNFAEHLNLLTKSPVYAPRSFLALPKITDKAYTSNGTWHTGWIDDEKGFGKFDFYKKKKK
jgi:RHS repeat-associated protein